MLDYGKAGLVALFLILIISPIPAKECTTDGVNDNCLAALAYKNKIFEINPDNSESIYAALNLVSPDSRSLDEFLDKEGDELTKLLFDQPRGPWRYKNFFLDPRDSDLNEYAKKLSGLVSEENRERFYESPYGYIVKLRGRPLGSYGKISTSELNSKREEILGSHQIALDYIKNNFPDAQVRHQFTGVFNGISLKISADEAKQLKNLNIVGGIYPIKRIQISLTESISMINADDAWGLLDDTGRNVTGRDILIAIVDTGVDYTHTDFGNCSPTQISGDMVDYSLESEHPYENDMSKTWTITMPGFTSIAVHFSRLDVNGGWDYIIVSDASGNTVKEYSGTYGKDVWTPSVDGDTIKVTLKSDNTVTDWGFAIDRVINGTISFSWDSCPKIAGGYDFVNNDSDPMDDAGHGTHVAGIALSNGSLKGIAPDAKLLAYKVMDSSGEGYNDDIIAGIERAVNDSADVISLSLGGSGNPDDALSQAVDNAANAGSVVVAAAGNSGPDARTIGSPGCARKAITIGATYKEGYNTTTSELYLLNDTAAGEIDSEPLEKSALTPKGGITAEILFASLGYAGNFTGQNFTGKIALIERGESYFYEKVRNAYDAGAVGAIIYNNQIGNFIGNLVNYSDIPAVSISRSDGAHLLSLVNEGIVTVNLSVLSYSRLITDFSSRGPAYIYNKPDLVAPGELICASQWDDVYSDSPCYDSEHVAISGTSMATPHVAGAAALILQKHSDWSPDDVKYALLTTARDYGYDADVQGAGLIDVYKAVNLTNKPPIAIISDITGLEYRN